MIPNALNEWTLEVVTTLLKNNYMEQESFDWKEALPDKRNDKSKKGLRIDCCAFANSNGGFLVYGVKDDKTLPVQDRLEGFEANFDFPIHFGNFPSECNPSVHWESKKPAIPLPNGKVIHVVQLPRSWRTPHSVGIPKEGFLFPKRTNMGTEYMNTEEVRMSFLGFYEKRIKLQLLSSELASLRHQVAGLVPSGRYFKWTNATITELRTTVIDTVIVDTYSVLCDDKKLLQLLSIIRLTTKNINDFIEHIRPIFWTFRLVPFVDIAIFRAHNRRLESLIPGLLAAIDEAISLLKPFLSH